MSRMSYKISLPIILAGLFAVTIFIALNYQGTNVTTYITLLLLVLFTFFFGYATGQSLSSPIKQLVEKANRLSNGNLSEPVYLETKDELSDLAKALNQIASELETSQDSSRKAEELVDMKVRARTKALEDTINSLDQKVKNRTIELERLVRESAQMQAEVRAKEVEMQKLKQELTSSHQKPARKKPSEGPVIHS